ncbi:MAG: acyl carrier protein [Gammaproteobacteria bacterium]|nr:acyl carrier protein [Gammaproteobacteria bacterium]NND60394.1 acyl carrier protein [Gammaproteobacteria bacterium]
MNQAATPYSNETLDEVRDCLATTLQLGESAASFTAETRLLGAVPELDSMAVVTVILSLEEHFGFEVDDDDISADEFATLGTLCEFVQSKVDS